MREDSLSTSNLWVPEIRFGQLVGRCIGGARCWEATVGRLRGAVHSRRSVLGCSALGRSDTPCQACHRARSSPESEYYPPATLSLSPHSATGRGSSRAANYERQSRTGDG